MGENKHANGTMDAKQGGKGCPTASNHRRYRVTVTMPDRQAVVLWLSEAWAAGAYQRYLKQGVA